jgi:hypothetical protein
MRLEARPDTTAEQQLELIELVAAELRAEVEAGATDITAVTTKPSDGEAFRVLVWSELHADPKVVAVREGGE